MVDTFPFGSTQIIDGVPQSAAQFGGSGKAYFNLVDAIAQEPNQETSGNTQAGTTKGVIVGPAGLSAVDDFYNGQFVVLTSVTPGNGKAAIWSRVIDYVGATRTLTIDSDLDFGVGLTFAIVNPVVVDMNKDSVGNISINKSCIINMGGCKIKGQVNINGGSGAAAFVWFRNGEITDGIQDARFSAFGVGVVRLDNVVVSARTTTIYAFKKTNATNVGGFEFYNCEFRGVVAGTQGIARWVISNCRNLGIEDGAGNIPYRLLEASGIARTFSNFSADIAGEFDGAFFFANTGGSIAAAAPNFLSITADIHCVFGGDSSNLTNSPSQVSLVHVTGTGTTAITATTGQIDISCSIANGGIEIGDQSTTLLGFAILRGRAYTGAGATLTISSGLVIDIDLSAFGGISSMICVDGPGGGSTGSLTLNGGAEVDVTLGTAGMFSGILLREVYSGAGVITCAQGRLITKGGKFVSGVYFATDQTTNTPTVTSSMPWRVENCYQFDWFAVDDDVVNISKGSYTFNGAFAGIALGNYSCFLDGIVSGGTFTVSGTIVLTLAGALNTLAANNQAFLDLCSHTGTGGTLTVSGSVFAIGGQNRNFWHCRATLAGGTATRSGSTFVRLMTIFNSNSFVQSDDASGAKSNAVGSGALFFYSVMFEQAAAAAINIVKATGSATGPSQLAFEFCRFDAAGLTTQTGAGTLTWAAGSISFYMDQCSMLGTFTIVGTPFSFFEVFGSTFYGSISFSGSRPTARYAYFKCSFQTTFFDATGKPDILDDYFILANNSSSKSRGQLVKTGTTPSVINTGSTDVVDGVVFEAVGANTNPVVLVRSGVISVLATGSVAIGDNLILDAAGTPTKVVPFVAGTLLVGQNIGRALTADSGGLAYTNVDIK